MAGVIQRAREEGIQRGLEQGLERGMEQGMERGLEQGLERGLERGMERGRVEGERSVLERLLRRRFGRLPSRMARRLDGASRADLESWADNVLDAATLDEVFD